MPLTLWGKALSPTSLLKYQNKKATHLSSLFLYAYTCGNSPYKQKFHTGRKLSTYRKFLLPYNEINRREKSTLVPKKVSGYRMRLTTL